MNREDVSDSLIIGYLKNIDFDGLRDYRLSLKDIQMKNQYQDWRFGHKDNQDKLGQYKNSVSVTYFDRMLSFYNKDEGEEASAIILEQTNKFIKEIKAVLDYSIKFNNPMAIYFTDDYITIVGWGNHKECLPTKFIEFELNKNYDDVLPEDLPIAMGIVGSKEEFNKLESVSKSLIISNNNIPNRAKKTVVQDLEQKKEEIALQERELKNALEKLREEAQLKEQELRNQMSVKMAELVEKKKAMEVEIFGLDRQLYLLRCLLGDSVKITHLRKGKNAPKQNPVILYQKLRYIDEDFAKIKALYSQLYDDYEYIEEILQKDDFVVNQFCPSDKCIVILKMSKDSRVYGKGDGNYLEKYAYLNGNKAAILIKNGENLYIAWTEQDRIYIKENFFYGFKQSEMQEGDERPADRDEVIIDGDYTKGTAWKQYFSREFLFTILQGFTEYSKLIEFPEPINFYNPDPKYVIFSSADNAIGDSRFGTLEDFADSRNVLTNQGDYILPLQSISGSVAINSNGGWSRYNEDFSRGRGDKNRVRDCHISKNIQKINLVERESNEDYLHQRKDTDEKLDDEKQKKLRDEYEEYDKALKLLEEAEFKNKWDTKVKIGNIEYSYVTAYAGKNHVWKATNQPYNIREGIIRKTTYLSDCRYYVSVDKNSYSDTPSKKRVASNVRIYEDEFLNLTYLSSGMLIYFMETKQIGRMSFGGVSVNFAYVIEALHAAIKFVRNRENDELIRIGCIIKNIKEVPNIDLILTNWKYKNEVRSINDYQAKRFAKYFKSIDVEVEYKSILNNIDWKKEIKN